MNELEVKLSGLHQLLESKKLDVLILQRVSSFAWVTGGVRSYINTADTLGVATLLIFRDKKMLVTNNQEAGRLEKEDALGDQGWIFQVKQWFDPRDLVPELTAGLKTGSDVPYAGAEDVSLDIARLRSILTPEECERYRVVGKLCGEAVENAALAVRPGMTEYQIGSLLTSECELRGVQAIVNLIAVDDRIFSYRHFLPTDKKLERYAMLVLCGRRWGLVGALTRLVYFGKLTEEMRQKEQAVAGVDATIISATRPGKTLGDAFQIIKNAYSEFGFSDQWKIHHQGGSIAYEPREFLASPGNTEAILLNEAFAWNPTIAGTKSEDTILVGEKGNDIITSTGKWPVISVPVDGQILQRPAILEIT